jgi:hypothetical protein
MAKLGLMGAGRPLGSSEFPELTHCGPVGLAIVLRLLRRNVSSDAHSHCGFYPMKASLVAISDAQAYKQ